MDVINKTILITGGTSGIGFALVKQLSKNNRVLILARSAEKMATLFGTNSNIHCYCCDLASPKAVAQALGKIITDHPGTSIVINNAGIQQPILFTADNFNLESINEEIQVNLQAPLLISAIFIKHWQHNNQPSAIVNISSALAIFPKTSAAVYCATKAALHNFHNHLLINWKILAYKCTKQYCPWLTPP